MVRFAWSRPRKNFLKINVKAFSTHQDSIQMTENGNSNGIGGVIRDTRGNLVMGFAGILVEENPLIISLRGCFAGVRIAVDLFTEEDERNEMILLQLETGDEAARDTIDAAAFGAQNVPVLVDRLLELMNEVNTCFYSMVRPQANRAASFMADHALHNLKPGNLFIFTEPFGDLHQLLKIDMNRDMMYEPFHDEIFDLLEETRFEGIEDIEADDVLLHWNPQQAVNDDLWNQMEGVHASNNAGISYLKRDKVANNEGWDLDNGPVQL